MLQKIKNLFNKIFRKEKKEPPRKINVELGPININIIGVAGEKRYESNKTIMEDVKSTVRNQPINVSSTPRSKDPYKLYPRVYIDNQVWSTGEITYDSLLTEVYKIVKEKERLARQIATQRNSAISKSRTVLCYAQSYFDTGVDTIGNTLLVPSHNYNFIVHNLDVKSQVNRVGGGATTEEIRAMQNNDYHIFDARPYEKENLPVNLDFGFTSHGIQRIS